MSQIAKERIIVYVTEEEKALIYAKAEGAGQSASVFCRAASVSKAMKSK